MEVAYLVSLLRRLFGRFSLSYVFLGTFPIEFISLAPLLDDIPLIVFLAKVRYSRLLEEGDFRGRPAHYIWMLLFGILNISTMASYYQVNFLGSALTFMMAYVWGRRNEDVKMSFLGFLQFNAPYLPWVMLTFSVLIGNAVVMDVIGICVGHLYYFLEFVYPVMASIRNWPIRQLMEPPALLHLICGTHENAFPARPHQD
jgi:Derlin-2/3